MLKDITAEELGPYHEDTLQKQQNVLRELFITLRAVTGVSIYPDEIFFLTDCLEASDTIILQNALYCKALNRGCEIAPLWDGVVDQAKLLPTSE